MSFIAPIVNPKEDWKAALNSGGNLIPMIEGWQYVMINITYSPFPCHPLNFVILC